MTTPLPPPLSLPQLIDRQEKRNAEILKEIRLLEDVVMRTTFLRVPGDESDASRTASRELKAEDNIAKLREKIESSSSSSSHSSSFASDLSAQAERTGFERFVESHGLYMTLDEHVRGRLLANLESLSSSSSVAYFGGGEERDAYVDKLIQLEATFARLRRAVTRAAGELEDARLETQREYQDRIVVAMNVLRTTLLTSVSSSAAGEGPLDQLEAVAPAGGRKQEEDERLYGEMCLLGAMFEEAIALTERPR